MKRFFFSLIALSAAAIGCTQSALLETPEQFGTEITFSPYTGRTPVTKATDIVQATGLANAGGFQILGFLTQGTTTTPYMDKLVTGTINPAEGENEDGVTWSYRGNTYWPDASTSSTTTLSFVGYSANAVGLINWTQDKVNEEFVYTVPETVSQQVDLLATNYQTGLSLASNSTGIVNLQFNHLLSKVGFKLKANKTNGDIQVHISNLALCGTMPTQGTLNLLSAENKYSDQNDDGAAPALVNLTNTKEATAENPDKKTTYALLAQEVALDSNSEAQRIANGTNHFMMIMPHTSTNDEIQITYQIKSKDGRESQVINAMVPLDGMNFVAGMAYEFILEVSTSSIGFTVEETDWNNSGKGEEIETPIFPEPADAIDLGANVKSTTEVTVATYINVNRFEEIYLQYKEGDGTASWTDPNPENDPKVSSYDTPNEIGGPYNYSITGLYPNTKYQYRIAAKKDDGTYEYSATHTFVTLAVLTTGAATDPTSFGATLHGTWSGNGLAPLKSFGFCWSEGEDSTPTVRLFLMKHDFVAENADFVPSGNFEYEFSNQAKMKPNTTYRYRAYCVNEDGGVSYGDPVSFSTSVAFVVPGTEADPDKPEEGDGTTEPGDGNENDEDKPIFPWEEDDDEEIEF